MICPHCGAENEFGTKHCKKCGERVVPRGYYESTFDYSQEIVYSNKSKNKKKKEKRARMRLLIILGGAALAIIIVVLIMLRGCNGRTNPPAVVETTEATEVQTTESTAQQKTTAASEADQKAESKQDNKLEAYLKNSRIREVIESQADSNMSVSVYTEGNLIVAVYTVNADPADPGMSEYISTLDGYFEHVCASLDEEIFELKQATGIKNAELEVRCLDASGALLFDRNIS